MTRSIARSVVCFLVGGSFVQFAAQLAPQTNVSDSLLVTCDHNLSAFFDCASVFTASPANPSRSHLRVDQLARAAFTDPNAELAEHAHHLEVCRIEKFLVRHQEPGEKEKNDRSSC